MRSFFLVMLQAFARTVDQRAADVRPSRVDRAQQATGRGVRSQSSAVIVHDAHAVPFPHAIHERLVVVGQPGFIDAEQRKVDTLLGETARAARRAVLG